MRVATGILAVALAVLWLGFAPVQIGGAVVYTATVGNSMEPLFHKGDLALVRPAGSYKVGDIVLYRSPVLQRPVLHRIIAVDQGRYVFKGDHNDFVDPGYASRADLIGKLWLHVPTAGKAIGFIAKPAHSAALIGAAMLLLALPGARIRRRKKRHPAVRAPLHLHRPRHPAEDAVTVALVVAAAAAIVVGFTSPLKRAVSIDGAYQQSGTFSYSAATGKPDAAYPTGHLRTGDPLFLHHVDLVHFKYVYRLSSIFAHGVRGTIGLSARVALESSSWHQSYVLVKGRPFSGDTATVQTDLSLKQDLMSIVHELTIDSGSPAGQYDLTLQPVVHVRGFVNGHRVDSIFAPVLAFTLSGDTIQLNPGQPAALPGQGIVPGSAKAALDAAIHPVAVGSIPGKAPAYRTIARARLSVLDLRGLGLGLGGLAFLVLLTRPLRRRHDSWSPEQQQASRQGCVIVDVVALDLSGSRTEVRSFSDLVAFARYLERPILHDLHTGTFAADDGGRLCTYRPAVETAPVPQPVAPAAAPRRRGVRLRWLGLGLAIVVAAGIVVSFTAANVVPLTNAGVATDATSLAEITPARCAGMNLTHLVVSPTGTVTGTAANDLILDASAAKGTLTGGAGNDCIVSGAAKETLDGGAGTDVCIGTGSNTNFKNCESTYTTP